MICRGTLAVLVISGALPLSAFLHTLWVLSVRVGHQSTVFTTSRNLFHSTELSCKSLLLACSVIISTNVDRHSLRVPYQGHFQE